MEEKKVTFTNKIPHTPLTFLWYVSKPSKWWAFFAILGSIALSGASQSTNLFFKFIVDAAESGDIEKALTYGLLYPATLFVIQVLWRLDGYWGMNWTLNAEEKGYNDLVHYTLGHSHSYYSDRFAGSILSKITNVTKATEDLIISFLWTHLSSITSFAVTFVLISMVSPVSGIIFLGLLSVLVVVNIKLSPGKMQRSLALAESATKLRGFIVDLFANAGAVRQYSAVPFEFQSLKEQVSEYKLRGRKSWLYTERMLLVNVVILSIFNIGMFYVLIKNWETGLITTGDFVLVLGLVSQITGTLVFIGRAFNQTARSFGEAKEGLVDILIEHEVADSQDAPALKSVEGCIDWKEVIFEYGENKVFNNFSLTIPAGQRVGLVGQSGAGKTTFVSLLLRQHDLTAGSILIDGQDIAAVSQDSLREHIAVVPQEPLLFHRSIRENIAYGNPQATYEDIIAVAKKAQAHDFITALPEGYETLVGERGVKLSGGQKQRVAIARAMLKDAPILILDEATSALDSESEVLIQKALHELMEGKTVIAIAHRLSTLREMDRILVLDQGVIVEDGTHATLSAAGGTYAKLWQHQAGGFLQE